MDIRTDRPDDTTERELVIERFVDAPRELVWKAWTDPDMCTRWWGPKGFTSPVFNADFRVGGKYHGCMRSPEGQDFWSTGVFHEIVPPERLVMTDSFADEEGNVVPSTHYGMDSDFPLEMVISVTLEEREGKTKMTLRHSGTANISDKDREDMRQGWSESFDKLDEYLAREFPHAKRAA